MIVASIAATILLGDRAAAAYEGVFAFSNETFGWLYVLAVSAFLIALVVSVLLFISICSTAD